jgi:hypothetical protein
MREEEFMLFGMGRVYVLKMEGLVLTCVNSNKILKA